MKTAIVILNWNGKELLERFMPSVVSSSADLAKVYLADNASTDDSVSYCKEHFPEVVIIQNSVNGGYAKGYNDALQDIQADLFVLLNSDVETPAGWLAPMITLFEKESSLGAAQPKILDLNKRTHFEYAGAAGGFLDALGYPYCRGRIFEHCERDNAQYNDTIEVQWASGACLFVKADVFKNVGGFDEDYFAHQEEIDLCWRIRNAGFKIMGSGESAVFHLGGGTLSTNNPKKTFYNFRNSLFTIVKNEARGVLLRIFARLILDGVAGVRFIFLGKFNHFWAIIKAHFSFYYSLPKFIAKRKVQKNKSSSSRPKAIVYSYYIKGIRRYSQMKIKKG